MKVLDLQCANQHSFEGWFASEDDFQSQLARSLVDCPICCDRAIQKMPSAPRLNLGVYQVDGSSSKNRPQQPGDSPRSPEMAVQKNAVVGAPSEEPVHSPAEQAAFFTALRQMVANTEDMGDKFAHEARAMHYGDAQVRSIRGQASAREAVELLKEGIDVLPLPPHFKETLQ